MRLDEFFDKFELFAEAPNAVDKLRELILQLAVTGKLVPQLSSEDAADELLKAASAERQSKIATRKIKNRQSSPVNLDEQPFRIPGTWQWARLSDVGYELGQKVPDRRFTYIDVGGVESKKGRISDSVAVLEPHEAPSRARKLVTNGTVIYSTVRPYLLNIAIVDREFEYEPIVSTAFGILHPFVGINNRYIFYWLRSKPFIAYVQDGMKGMAYPAINDEKFYSGFIPVPPLAEQKRIVAKVDELMVLCDRLEAQQQERATRHAALTRASLARFAAAPTPANLEYLFHDSYAITPADLRKTILTLAVQGKLVPQEQNDEPMDLSGIAQKMKQTSESAPFVVPNTWCWVQLGQVGSLINGDRSKNYPNKDEYVQEGVPWINTGHIEPDGTLSVDSMHYISRDKFDSLRSGKVQKNDLVYCLRGATLGKTAIITQFDEGAIASSLVIIRFTSVVEPKYAYFVLTGPLGREQIFQFDNGSAQPNLSANSVSKYWFPLPPVMEQRRIVAKVEQLMALVDQLEGQLTASRAIAEKLMAAMVAELTAVAA